MYVLLGSNGNITSKVAALLLGQGTPVRVVGRNTGSLASVKAAGADIAAGDIGDAGFLAQAFAGATAAYTMIPTDYAAQDMAAEQDRLGNAIARAIAAAGLKRVVNLSSVGAHLSSGTGPIAGLHRQERRLNELADVDVLHLRPGYFFENHLIAIEMIRTIGAYADMTAPDSPLPMVATADIAQVVARELRTPSGKGKHVLHLRAPSLYTMKEATAVLGAAIGKPDLAYVQSDPEQGRAALMQQGFSANAAAQLVEMSAAFSTGRLDGEYDKGPAEITPTTLADFAAAVFRPAFEKT
ncbi:NmrA family NAD(P)-binding protein [Variovorax paradoxus]|uniref:NmrA-like family protein n=1 Tax=Variovorax paradoxus TaxID=34073 RepID=A0A0H2M4Z9_VARPD|nr:NmrA family NAD(P)-binding protein [Variovorax paradoxus]KLN57221.1 NmrA-like family protein [Variovorax paradoxus]